MRAQADESFASADPILPDGCVEIVFNFADAFLEDTTQGIVAHARTQIVGRVGEPVSAWPSGNIDLLGVRIEPGAVRRVLGTSEHFGHGVDYHDVLAPALRRELNQVFDVHATQRASLIERTLRRHLREPTMGDALAMRISRQLVAGDLSPRIDDLAARANVSTRHIERAFTESVGLSPKAFSTLHRFRRALAQLTHASSIGTLAAATGYSDHAHFTRDFRRFTGVSPSQYLKRHRPVADAFLQAN